MRKNPYQINKISLLFFILCSIGSCLNQNIPELVPQTSKELTTIQSKNDYIYLNTIDGYFYAVDKLDGKIKWSLKEAAVLKFPKNYENPYFLTDPRDGSLYIFTNKNSGLKKFPYTIAELVSASPSKSMDGYLYTGDKKDEWLAIDYKSGRKLDTLTSDTLASKISTDDENVLLIGRTQYTISMFDMNTRKKIFNLTYYDYSTHSHTNKISVDKPIPQTPNFNNNNRDNKFSNNEYPYYHFSSSSDGTLVTLDKKTGNCL
ncbi:unnamed protein product [Brachionus calyciflorus]|uniref:Uncharacterized protein n=1 Tax=Brachionus calyciflorus TaxID=104777 RepID=A0A814H7M4_9BILA|nr:unnamed protein product [Brachionus calyciflorus]